MFSLLPLLLYKSCCWCSIEDEDEIFVEPGIDEFSFIFVFILYDNSWLISFALCIMIIKYSTIDSASRVDSWTKVEVAGRLSFKLERSLSEMKKVIGNKFFV